MRTTTDLPVRSFVTRTWVPNGRVLCAAVSALVLNRSPLAVRFPWKPGPYQDAAPVWMDLAWLMETMLKLHGLAAQLCCQGASQSLTCLQSFTCSEWERARSHGTKPGV